MKSNIKFFLFFVVPAFVAGCQIILGQKQVDDGASINAPNDIQAPVITESIVTPTALSYGNFVCPKIIAPKNIGDITSGRLLYVDYDRYELKSLDLQTTTSTSLIPEGEKMVSYALSPNANWLVYKSVNVTTSKEELIVTNINKDEENKTTSLPWEHGWDKVAYWLNGEQVVIKMFPDKYNRNLLFNPFSGEKQILLANFPNQYFTDRALDWNRAGQFTYNSTLTRVVYAETNQNLIMRDVVNNKEVVRVSSFALNTHHTQSPQWTLNGEKVIMAAVYNKDEARELLSIDQNGVVQKLTDLASINSNVTRYGWSPDNRYIAMFILTPEHEHERLAVLDTYTQKMDIYCIEGDTSVATIFDYRGTTDKGLDANIYKAVVWSPDSRQLIMENRLSENSSRIILVDVEKKEAYEILNNVNYQPVGWASP